MAPALNKELLYIQATIDCGFTLKLVSNMIITYSQIYIYIVYELGFSTRGYDDDTVVANSLFGAVRLVKDADIDKYKYSGYGIGFDGRGSFSVPSSWFG